MDHPVWKHFLIIAKFFIFTCLLSASDIFTDILTAKHFFENNKMYWGICTAVPLFAPFAARVTQSLVQVAMCVWVERDGCKITCNKNDVRLKILAQELPNLIWSFPLFQPIR